MENFDFIDLKTAIAKFHFTLFNLFAKFQKENSLTDLKRKEAIIKLTNHVWLMDKLLINENRIATIGILQKKVLALDKTSRNELFKTLCIDRKELVDHFKSSFCTHTYKDFILVPDKGISITSYIKILETSIGFFGTIINEVFKPFYKELDKLEQENTSTKKWEELIKIELQPRLKEIESKIESKIENWKQRKDLIECAAFCQLLYDFKYFEKNTTKRVSVNLFAKSRFGTDIEIQLNSKNKSYRETHKKLLKKFF